MLELPVWIEALLLLVVANSVPWLLGRLTRRHQAWPLDFGCTLPDRERLFGDHKTWRGLAGGALACAILATLLGHGFAIGLGFGALSLSGDALSSGIKRRLRLRPGANAPVLDQLPEALLPLASCGPSLGLGWSQIAAVTLIFMCLDLVATRLQR